MRRPAIDHVAALSDTELRALFDRDPARAWRAFIEAQTPTIVALIERLGIRDRDEAMDLYTRVCERLTERDCARLRARRPDQGSLAGWLAVVVRHVAVDWIRSRAGRRRLFGVVGALDPLHQQVFQHYYWAERAPSEIAETLSVDLGRRVGLIEVLRALDEIHERLTARHFSELVSMTMRARPPVSLDPGEDTAGFDVPDPAPAVDVQAEVREREARLDEALSKLPVEDAAIVRLHYLQGLSLTAVQRALHVPPVTRARLKAIVEALRQHLVDEPDMTSVVPQTGGQA